MTYLLTRPAFDHPSASDLVFLCVTMASNPSPAEVTLAVYAAKGRALHGKFLAELEFRSHSPKSLPYVPVLLEPSLVPIWGWPGPARLYTYTQVHGGRALLITSASTSSSDLPPHYYT